MSDISPFHRAADPASSPAHSSAALIESFYFRLTSSRKQSRTHPAGYVFILHCGNTAVQILIVH